MKQSDSSAQRALPNGANWRQQRKLGSFIIAASALIAVGVWLSIRHLAPQVSGIASVADALVYAFKWWCLAVLFCFATGIDAVAHERLQSPAFDPLVGYETRRLRVNLRYLQNTLEQLIMFTAGLFGLALYNHDAGSIRAVEATAVVWILFRFAFWIGYHRSAALRSLGAAGVGMSLIVLIYVAARISLDFGGVIAMWLTIGAFLAIEGFLFWATRFRENSVGQ
jgi:hypothetical protein